MTWIYFPFKCLSIKSWSVKSKYSDLPSSAPYWSGSRLNNNSRSERLTTDSALTDLNVSAAMCPVRSGWWWSHEWLATVFSLADTTSRFKITHETTVVWLDNWERVCYYIISHVTVVWHNLPTLCSDLITILLFLEKVSIRIQ